MDPSQDNGVHPDTGEPYDYETTDGEGASYCDEFPPPLPDGDKP